MTFIDLISKGCRRRTRELAFKTIYAWEINDKNNLDQIIDNLEVENFLNKEVDKEYYYKLVKGISENYKHIDKILKGIVEKWDFKRIFPVEKVLLRVGAYEILYENLPKAVVINEAVELAKIYADKESPSFINGILDKLK